MDQYRIIYVTCQAILIVGCFWIVGLILRLWKRKGHHLAHGVTLLAIALWMAAKGCVHISQFMIMLGFKAQLFLLIAVSLNAVAIIVAVLFIRVFAIRLMSTPSAQELKQTTNALAKTVADLKEKTETLEEDGRRKEAKQ